MPFLTMKSNKVNLSNKTDTIRETVISSVETLRLKGVSIQQFINFKKPRDLYEKQIEESSRYLKEEVIATSLRVSMENENLKIFIAAGWIEAPSLDEVTERQIEHCIEERCSRSLTGEKLYLVDRAVKNRASRSKGSIVVLERGVP